MNLVEHFLYADKLSAFPSVNCLLKLYVFISSLAFLLAGMFILVVLAFDRAITQTHALQMNQYLCHQSL